MAANDTQIGGGHYKKQKIEHWDWVAANSLDYFQGNITKYVSRWRDKGGIEDLLKARHYLDKYIEVEQAKVDKPAAKLSPEFIDVTTLFAEAPTYDDKRIEKQYDGQRLEKASQRLEKAIDEALLHHQHDSFWSHPPAAITRMEEPRLYPNVDPLSGWVNAQFEGSDANGSLWRCRRCHESFRSPVHACPDDYHPCRLEGNDTGVAGPKYTNQG
jgi:hypothetical protein